MDLKVLEEILKCKSVPAINRVAGTDLKSEDYFIEGAKKKFIEDACKAHNVELCDSVEDTVLTIVESQEYNDNQARIRDILYPHGHYIKPLKPHKIEEYNDEQDSEPVLKEQKIPRVLSESKIEDPYDAGPCPKCGKHAISTWRHPGAPVTCENAHLWFRNTDILAESPSESRIIEEANEDDVEDIVNKIKMCPDYSSLYYLEEDFNRLGMTIAQTNNKRVILCAIGENNKPKNTKIFEDYMFVGSATNPDIEISNRVAECLVQFIKKTASGPKKLSKSDKHWLDGLAPYGDAVGVEQDRPSTR